MERVALNKYFYLDEYIPKELYKRFQKKPHILIGLLDVRLLNSDFLLREKFGPITINNWWNGGNRNWSGLRTLDSPYYSPTSQHSFGRASDKIFHSATVGEVREDIKEYWEEYGIMCIEENVTWIHSDVRLWKDGAELLIVYP